MDTNLNLAVTVLISAFNAEEYITQTIESILNQTFKNFELLIVDDGSTDSTHSQILAFSDSRVRLIQNENNEGLKASLNKGLLYSKTKYIARLDADDIALPTRLEKQFAFMEANPNVGLCGTFAEVFGSETGIMKAPIEDDVIAVDLCFYNCFVHSSVMIRRSVLDQYKLLYRLPFCEDYDLWCQISRVSQVHNIPEILVRYRRFGAQMTKIYHLKFVEFDNQVVGSHLDVLFRNILSSDELKLLQIVIVKPMARPDYAKILNVIKKLNTYNDEHRVRNKSAFLKTLKKQIILHQMRATKKYHFNDFILIIKSHLRLIYEILGYRYGTKLLLCMLIAKRKK